MTPNRTQPTVGDGAMFSLSSQPCHTICKAHVRVGSACVQHALPRTAPAAAQRRHHHKLRKQKAAVPRGPKTSLPVRRAGASRKVPAPTFASVQQAQAAAAAAAAVAAPARFSLPLLNWPYRIVIVDSYNVMLARIRLPKRLWWYTTKDKMMRFANQLARFAATRGCRVFAMVEGTARNLKAPDGVQFIRAEKLRRKNIGDDAIVRYVERALGHGVEPQWLVLITADKGLKARMPLGVNKRSPEWLWNEMALGQEDVTATPVASSAARLGARGAAGVPTDVATREGWRRWWLDWSSYLSAMWRLPLGSSLSPRQGLREER